MSQSSVCQGVGRFSSPNWILEAEVLISSSALLRTFLFTLANSFQSLVVLVLKDTRSHPFLCRWTNCFQVIPSLFWRPQTWHFHLSLDYNLSELKSYQSLGMPNVCQAAIWRLSIPSILSPYPKPCCCRHTTREVAFGKADRNCCVKDSEARLWGAISLWQLLVSRAQCGIYVNGLSKQTKKEVT